MALIFKKSRLYFEPFIPNVIHGEPRKRTRFVFNGADLLAMAKRKKIELDNA